MEFKLLRFAHWFFVSVTNKYSVFSLVSVGCGGCSGGMVSPARLKGISASGISWNWSVAFLAFISGAIVADGIGKVLSCEEVENLISLS